MGGRAGDSQSRGQPCTAPCAVLKMAGDISKPHWCPQALCRSGCPPDAISQGCLQPSPGGTELPQGTKSIRAGPHSATISVPGLTGHGATLTLTHPALSCTSHLFSKHQDPTGRSPGHRDHPSGARPRTPPRTASLSTHAESVHVAIPIKASCLAEGPGSAAFISLPGRGLCKLSPRLTD